MTLELFFSSDIIQLKKVVDIHGYYYSNSVKKGFLIFKAGKAVFLNLYI